jgi:hypothetical protein
MYRSLSPAPSLSLRLDQIRAVREAGAVAAAFPRWRAAADGLGMAMFLVLLGAYLAVRLYA